MTDLQSVRTALVSAGAPFLLCVAAAAAPRLGPPTRFMHDDGHRSAVVEIAEVTAEGRFRLEVIERLFGETADGLVVRATGAESWIEAGRTYILGHTDKPARRSYRWDTDPEGPRVLGVPGVGPAVFENSSAMRTLVGERPEGEPLTDRVRLDAVLEQLGRDDVLSRRFVLAELALDPGLRERVQEPDLELLRRALDSGELEPMAHDYLLRAARPMIDRWGGEWLAADCRRLVSSHGPQLDLASLVPSLLVTAFETLALTGGAPDAELARPHLASNNPGVGRAAFTAMTALDPRLAAEVASAEGDSEKLHPDTRLLLRRYAARSDQPSSR